MNLIDKLVHGVVTHKAECFLISGYMFAAGCIATTIMQTIKACDIIEEANERLDAVDEGGNTEEPSEDLKNEMKLIRKETNLKLAKNYILPASLAIASGVCFLGSYKVLSSEKAAALAALSSVTAAFEKYRARVVDKYGAQEDYNLYNGIETHEVTTVDKDGNEVKTTVTSKDPIDDNCYTKVFSFETSGEWKSNRKLNLEFLRFYERYWNQQLKIKGYVTYNEVIESLGFSRRVGDMMTERFIPNGIGWISSEIVPDELEGQFDTFIKFAPSKDEYMHEPYDLVYEDAYLLNFNCYPIDGLLQAKAQKVEYGEH